ncbi:MAG TPA: hypothetical protein DCE42_12000, partial [Myxococcales bacterium]|nr:hypothetical protein [Myxococcales bacterium]
LSLVFAYTKEHPDLDSLVRLLKHLQPLLLGFDDPEHILRFLELIDKLMLVFQHRESRQAKAWLLSLEEIKHQATNRQAIRELIRKYEKHPTDQRTREIIQRYVNFLTPHDAKPLLDGFAECRNKQTEEFWSNVLAKRFEHQPKMLMPGIRTHAEPLVIQTCRILGKTGNAEALSLLDRASQHAHPLVRCEALTAIVKLDLKDASAVRIRNILEAHILDEDPQVKLNVLRQLPLTPKHGIRLLQQVLEEKWYESWSKEVLKVLASSIAKIGKKQPALLDTLIRVLEERYKGLFSGMKNQDFPRFVLHALFHESSLPTQRALQQLQKSPAKILRKLSKELSKG